MSFVECLRELMDEGGEVFVWTGDRAQPDGQRVVRVWPDYIELGNDEDEGVIIIPIDKITAIGPFR